MKVDSSRNDSDNPVADWIAAKQFFQSVLALPADQRESYVVQNCAEPRIRSQVLDLLRWHDSDSDFLLPFPDSAEELEQNTGQLIGCNIGGFVLLRVIGQGGMGTVYEAQQSSPHRTAAVKILRVDVTGVQISQRLARESMILARLQHPGIAQVYAAGTFRHATATLPWFAMELVNGQPLLNYANNENLSRVERLELLLSLCSAVQHAHERNIIHRDIKPDNVLVRCSSPLNAPDRIGQPTILDFGVARLRDTQRQQTLSTASGQLIGTLAYMSPEQLSGRPELVDARCDVYALGVIGYELLAGRPPHDRHGSSIIEILRKISAEKAVFLSSLDGTLRGELDLIFAKAVQADVQRRYQSVAELAEDIRAYLNHQPIKARRDSWTYRSRKFVRRNRVLVGGTAATFLSLAIGILAYAREASRARQSALQAETAAFESQYEADKAKAINEFLTNDFLMRFLETAQRDGATDRLAAIEHAKLAAANVSSMWKNKPAIEAAVRNELGTLYYNLRDMQASLEQFEMALQLWEGALGSDHPDTLKAVNNLGQSLLQSGRAADAEAWLKRAVEGRLKKLGELNQFTLASMHNLSSVFLARGDFESAEVWLKRCLNGKIQLLGKDHVDTIASMANYGLLLIQRGRIEEALHWHQQAYSLSHDTLGTNHLSTLNSGLRLGQTLYRCKKYPESLQLLTEILPGFENVYGDRHLETVAARRSLAKVYLALGKHALAIEQLNVALAIVLADEKAPKTLPERIMKEIQNAESEFSNHSAE